MSAETLFGGTEKKTQREKEREKGWKERLERKTGTQWAGTPIRLPQEELGSERSQHQILPEAHSEQINLQKR